MSDWIYAQDPDGVTQRARPGTPLPEGWSLIEERTPPADETDNSIRAETGSQKFKEFFASLLGIPSVDDTLREGGIPWMMAAGGALTGARLGGGTGQNVSRFLNKLRPSFMGQAGDAAVVSGAIGQANPLLASAPTVEGLQRTYVGGGAKAAAGAARNQTMQAIGANHPGFDQLLQDLADAGRAAYNPAQGQMRNTAGALAQGRDRDAILNHIRSILNPQELQQFEGAQRTYSQAKTLERLFDPSKRTAAAVGERGLNMPELQRKANAMEEMLRQRFGPAADDILLALRRGSTSPETDRRLQLSLSKTGGQLRIPLGFDWLAGQGHGGVPNLGPLGALFGAHLGGAGGYGLSQFLTE